MPDTVSPRSVPGPPPAGPVPALPRTVEPSATAGPADPFLPPPHTQRVAERALELSYRTALAVIRDQDLAAEVAQEVAIAAIRRAATLRDPAALDAWLHRTAVRAAITEARRRTARRAADDDFGQPTPAAADDRGPDTGPARRLLAGLPPRQRAAMTLRYVHDLDDRAIARALGWRVGTVRSLLARGRATLRFALDQADAPAGGDQ